MLDETAFEELRLEIDELQKGIYAELGRRRTDRDGGGSAPDILCQPDVQARGNWPSGTSCVVVSDNMSYNEVRGPPVEWTMPWFELIWEWDKEDGNVGPHIAEHGVSPEDVRGGI